MEKCSIEFFNQKKNDSYLNKDESDAIKGVLILLIIIGHCHILVPHRCLTWNFLYSFHVFTFFILPFFYRYKEVSIRNYYPKIIIRNWIPYSFFFLFSLLVFYFLSGQPNIDFVAIMKAYITGSSPLIRETVGFRFIWFLPAFCSFSLFKILIQKNKIFALIILISSLSLYIIPYSNYIYLINNIPFALIEGVKYSSLGFITFLMVKWSKNTKYVGALLFLLYTICFYLGYVKSLFFLPSIFFFLFMFAIKKKLKNKILIKLGKNSLQIYLLHVYVINGVNLFLPKDFFGASIIELLITLLVVYGLLVVIKKNQFINKLIFPRELKEWKTFYKKRK